jgi:hypothetical protein
MQIKFDAGACRKPRQAPVSQPLVFPSPPRFEGMPLCFVAVIPDAINRPRLPVQFGGVLIAETKLYGQLLHCLPGGDSTYNIRMRLYSLQASGSLPRPERRGLRSQVPDHACAAAKLYPTWLDPCRVDVADMKRH